MTQTAAVNRLRRSSSTTGIRAPESARLPLATLRWRLDAASTHAHWAINADGVPGRSLLMPADATVTVPLRLDREVAFAARVMLLPHDWRDGRGAVRAAVSVTDAGGDAHELWSELIGSSDRRGRPRGDAVDIRLPAWSTALALRIDAGPAQYRAVARAIWVEPTITNVHVSPPDGPRTSDTRTELPAGDCPLISVLTPVHDPPPAMLQEAIASVQQQTFTDWELCLVDDGSTNPEIIAALQRYAASDPRIHLIRHERAGGISAATNSALANAAGEYIALLDHDDTLTPDALQHVADQVAAEPGLDMIYSDEDILLDGRQIWVHLKPGWSPDTLRTNGYTCHLGVYRRELVGQIGGFRTEFNGSQDVDMILRLTERTNRIAHIPRILYHWRAHADSTAGGDAKPYAYVAARNAIAAHLQRIGLEADVGYGPPGLYRVAHRVPESTSVDIVLAIRSTAGLGEAAASWLTQTHRNWRLVLAAPSRLLGEAIVALTSAGVLDTQITAISTDQNPTSSLNTAASATDSEHLLLLQGPAVGLTRDWLTRLLGYSRQPGIAAAGPVVLAPDGRIQDAGIAIPNGVPLHLLHGTRSSMDHFFGYGTSVYNVSAVSGILATSRDTYEQLGGLDAQYDDLALIEYCMRATDSGRRVVTVPDARLRAVGPDLAINDLPAIHRLRRSWAQSHTHDPYYNPNYRTDRGDFERR